MKENETACFLVSEFNERMVGFMKLKRIFVCEMDDTEKALLEETVKVLKESKDSFEYYKNNFGGDIYKEYENTIDFLERLAQGRL